MRSLIFVLALSSLGATLVACRGTTGQSLGRTAANLVLPPSQEEQLGDQLAAQIEREMTVLRGGDVPRYVSQLGNKVVRAADDRHPEITFNFHVIRDDETINAFAIPGGEIYVTTGLLKEAANEAELSAVLAHEVAHVTQRHIAERLAVQYGISLLAGIALGQNPSQLQQIVASLVADGYLLKYSRDDEREADRIGMQYLVEAGYSPYGYVTFFERMTDQARPPLILSSHPHPEERVVNARTVIARYRRNVMEQPTYEARYERMTATL